MFKNLKKIVLSICSLFGLSILFWIIFLMNPSLSYAHQTQFGQISVYHNEELPIETTGILTQAYEHIKESELFDPTMEIQFCLNDGSFYPNLHPQRGATAYSFLNKTVIYRSKPDFKKNRASFAWEENQGELRNYDLVELLTHEFTHNLQYNKDWKHALKYEAWKLEGYAEYISRKNRRVELSLKDHVKRLKKETEKTHSGIPRITFKDGTGWTLSYYRFCLLVQFLIEEKGMSYQEILSDRLSMQEVEKELQQWAKQEPPR